MMLWRAPKLLDKGKCCGKKLKKAGCDECGSSFDSMGMETTGTGFIRMSDWMMGINRKQARV